MNDLNLFFDSLHLLEESSSDWQTINQNCLIIWYDDEFRRTFRHQYFLYLQNVNFAFDFVISHNVEIHVWKKDFPVFSLALFHLHKALCLAFQLLVQTRCDFVKLGLHQNYNTLSSNPQPINSDSVARLELWLIYQHDPVLIFDPSQLNLWKISSHSSFTQIITWDLIDRLSTF